MSDPLRPVFLADYVRSIQRAIDGERLTVRRAREIVNAPSVQAFDKYAGAIWLAAHRVDAASRAGTRNLRAVLRVLESDDATRAQIDALGDNKRVPQHGAGEARLIDETLRPFRSEAFWAWTASSDGRRNRVFDELLEDMHSVDLDPDARVALHALRQERWAEQTLLRAAGKLTSISTRVEPDWATVVLGDNGVNAGAFQSLRQGKPVLEAHVRTVGPPGLDDGVTWLDAIANAHGDAAHKDSFRAVRREAMAALRERDAQGIFNAMAAMHALSDRVLPKRAVDRLPESLRDKGRAMREQRHNSGRVWRYVRNRRGHIYVDSTCEGFTGLIYVVPEQDQERVRNNGTLDVLLGRVIQPRDGQPPAVVRWAEDAQAISVRHFMDGVRNNMHTEFISAPGRSLETLPVAGPPSTLTPEQGQQLVAIEREHGRDHFGRPTAASPHRTPPAQRPEPPQLPQLPQRPAAPLMRSKGELREAPARRGPSRGIGR